MPRLGLCCIFRKEPIRFRTTTARALAGHARDEQLARLSRLCLENAGSLLLALDAAHRMGIGAFRITSPLLPRFTHPEVAYRLEELPDGREIGLLLGRAKRFARRQDIRLSFHPDQFVVLSSPREEVVWNSIRELEYQGMLASLVGAEVINVHGGGVYGDKEAALSRFEKAFRLLSRKVRSRLTVENDEKSYTVSDLLPLCRRLGIPLVYDVHHHRCNPDGLSVEKATRQAVKTWEKSGKAPWFHISSPKNGWSRGDPRPHADYIDPADFPASWKNLNATVDVEAKAKELAVLKLAADLGKRKKGTPS
jgi:UV DNA damage endonuclease